MPVPWRRSRRAADTEPRRRAAAMYPCGSYSSPRGTEVVTAGKLTLLQTRGRFKWPGASGCVSVVRLAPVALAGGNIRNPGNRASKLSEIHPRSHTKEHEDHLSCSFV